MEIVSNGMNIPIPFFPSTNKKIVDENKEESLFDFSESLNNHISNNVTQDNEILPDADQQIERNTENIEKNTEIEKDQEINQNQQQVKESEIIIIEEDEENKNKNKNDENSKNEESSIRLSIPPEIDERNNENNWKIGSYDFSETSILSKPHVFYQEPEINSFFENITISTWDLIVYSTNWYKNSEKAPEDANMYDFSLSDILLFIYLRLCMEIIQFDKTEKYWRKLKKQTGIPSTDFGRFMSL